MLQLGPEELFNDENDELAIDLSAWEQARREDGNLLAPLINGRGMWYNANVQPGEKLLIDFRPGKDELGNLTGIRDSRLRIEEVTVMSSVKTIEDTVYWPHSLPPNVCAWFPLWTAPIEPISGWPIAYLPLSVQPPERERIHYPWDSCGSHQLPEVGSSEATMTATARYDWVEVTIGPMPYAGGSYTLDIRGATPTTEQYITFRVAEPGELSVIWQDGDEVEVFDFTVEVEWFWEDGRWVVDVGPNGEC